MNQDQVYFNFPVPLLRNAFGDIRQVMNDIMAYAGYMHTLKLDLGTSQKKMESAGNYFGVIYGNAAIAYDQGSNLFYELPKNSPMVGISKSILFDFYLNPKTEFDIAVLCAFLAVKSILGYKPYVKTTNDFLISRMAGYARVDEITDQIPDPLVKFTIRRMLDKIKLELQTSWGVNIYARYTRGFYVSIETIFPLEKLVLEAEKRREEHIEAQLRNKKETALIFALEMLKKKEMNHVHHMYIMCTPYVHLYKRIVQNMYIYRCKLCTPI